MTWLERKYLAQRLRRRRGIVDLRQPRRGQLAEYRLAAFRANENRNRADAFLEDHACLFTVQRDLADRCEHESASNRWMSGKWNLASRCVDANATRVSFRFGRKNEHTLRVVELARYREHLPVREPTRISNHGQRISAMQAIREYVGGVECVGHCA